MKLLTESVLKNLPPLYYYENNDTDPIATVKMFDPRGAATWWVYEGSFVDEHGTMIRQKSEVIESPAFDGVSAPLNAVDFLFFGFATLGDPVNAELGYVSFNELRSIKHTTIERDVNFDPLPISKIIKSVKSC